MDSWFLINFADLEAQQTKNHLQQQFPVATPSHCLEEFLQYTGLFLCLYGNGLVCLHIAGSELSDTANKAFSVSNLILEVYGCRRFTLASNKTFPNSFGPADRWTNAHAHTYINLFALVVCFRQTSCLGFSLFVWVFYVTVWASVGLIMYEGKICIVVRLQGDSVSVCVCVCACAGMGGGTF